MHTLVVSFVFKCLEPSCSAKQHLQGERLRVTCIFHLGVRLPVLAYIRAGEMMHVV